MKWEERKQSAYTDRQTDKESSESSESSMKQQQKTVKFWFPCGIYTFYILIYNYKLKFFFRFVRMTSGNLRKRRSRRGKDAESFRRGPVRKNQWGEVTWHRGQP